jgi:hypothetical protein
MARIRRSFSVLTHIAAERVFATANTRCKTPDSLARNYLAAVNKIIKKNNKPPSFFFNLLHTLELETTTHADITFVLKNALGDE